MVAAVAIDSRPILVGEANPYGDDPFFALYPEPETSAGGRLCRRIMRLEPRQYLRRFDRRNLCSSSWRIAEARESAERIGRDVNDAYRHGVTRKVVLLGAKVCAAFSLKFEPFTTQAHSDCATIILPHPSGLSRAWNEPGAFDRAHALLAKSGVL